MQPECRQFVVLVIYRRRFLTRKTLKVGHYGIGKLSFRSVRCAISEPRHVPQYVQDGVSNVSHLPAVNYRIQR